MGFSSIGHFGDFRSSERIGGHYEKHTEPNPLVIWHGLPFPPDFMLVIVTRLTSISYTLPILVMTYAISYLPENINVFKHKKYCNM